MLSRKIYNSYYKKEFNFPIITNHDELKKYIHSHFYFEKSPEIKFKKNYNTEILLNSPIYNKLDKKSIENTLKYIFDKYKTGVYVKITNNQLEQFIVLYNTNYKNDFSHVLKFQENSGTAKDYIKSKQDYYKGKIPRLNYDTSKWASTNCLLRTELDDEGPTEAYLPEFFDMLTKTCANRKVGNCIFFMTRKDFPNIKPDNTEADEHIWDSENKQMRPPFDTANFVPIFAQSSTIKHANLLIPSGDDWDVITQQFEAYKMKEGFQLPEWEDRKPVVIFRAGTATGCTNDPETNPRIKVSMMTKELQKKGINYLDAGIVRFTKRDKKIFGKKYVEFQKPDQYKDLVFNFIDRFEQTKYKFTLNIEGNSAAYRYGSLFGLGFCILNVESKYKMWFEQYLEPDVHYILIKHDLSNLIEKIEWCLKNDAKCKQISINAMEFYNKYFTRDFIYDYLSNSINAISNKYEQLELTYDRPALQNAMQVFNKYSECKFELIKPNINKNNKNNTVIIAPFRDNKFQDRKAQLELFKEHYKDYKCVIVEQSEDGRKFNRGALLNIGFKYCYQNYQYVIFHDIDILTPHNTMNKYYFDDLIGSNHLGHLTNKCIGCKLFFGAINKFDIESFKIINGFPNTFWGWGDEDVVLYYRCCRKKIKLYRPEFDEQFRVAELEHVLTNKIEELTNLTRYEKRIFDNIYYDLDGLMQCTYEITKTNLNNNPNHTHIIVNIK